uniref:Uncharacterized protein n=1 Tax=Chromera velia CCMP2878 TaxID=1169474 RepID=A0A0G4HSN2_9ALVE|eukprot:Cvel_8295.t1-p1 / transcript=Cvel_8295.t1 / gene=Cvel_8295 / organism=Chromera_velia_CCMP2878 / gene_product=hypothetical protein / transcript_product=hypothetical protein / location=Cvel_scaffold455:37836-38618(+) / protein_length=261 / sequence_SO=supercontig / SO=protein_coding / is_pseudo=false
MRDMFVKTFDANHPTKPESALLSDRKILAYNVTGRLPDLGTQLDFAMIPELAEANRTNNTVLMERLRDTYYRVGKYLELLAWMTELEEWHFNGGFDAESSYAVFAYLNFVYRWEGEGEGEQKEKKRGRPPFLEVVRWMSGSGAQHITVLVGRNQSTNPLAPHEWKQTTMIAEAQWWKGNPPGFQHLSLIPDSSVLGFLWTVRANYELLMSNKPIDFGCLSGRALWILAPLLEGTMTKTERLARLFFERNRMKPERKRPLKG